jgi:hypothetical protein
MTLLKKQYLLKPTQRFLRQPTMQFLPLKSFIDFPGIAEKNTTIVRRLESFIVSSLLMPAKIKGRFRKINSEASAVDLGTFNAPLLCWHISKKFSERNSLVKRTFHVDCSCFHFRSGSENRGAAVLLG